MKKNIIIAAVIFAGASVLFLSCKKKDDAKTPDYSIASETNSSQDDWDDILKVAEDALKDKDVYEGTRIASGCASITLDSTDTSNRKVVIDFGTSGCVGNDGRIRKGVLIIHYTGAYKDQGTVITITTDTTDNYYVNGKKVDGRRTVTSLGNGSGSYKFTIRDSGTDGTGYSKITQLDGGIATWKSTRTRVWSAGSSTSTIYDDQLIINGTAEGVSSKGVAYTMKANNIKLKASCWLLFIFAPVSGTLTLTADDGIRSLDYGDGDCDKAALYTHTNGKTYSITLY